MNKRALKFFFHEKHSFLTVPKKFLPKVIFSVPRINEKEK